MGVRVRGNIQNIVVINVYFYLVLGEAWEIGIDQISAFRLFNVNGDVVPRDPLYRRAALPLRPPSVLNLFVCSSFRPLFDQIF